MVQVRVNNSQTKITTFIFKFNYINTEVSILLLAYFIHSRAYLKGGGPGVRIGPHCLYVYTKTVQHILYD